MESISVIIPALVCCLEGFRCVDIATCATLDSTQLLSTGFPLTILTSYRRMKKLKSIKLSKGARLAQPFVAKQMSYLRLDVLPTCISYCHSARQSGSQSGVHNQEILVVDGGSHDHTVPVARKLGAKVAIHPVVLLPYDISSLTFSKLELCSTDVVGRQRASTADEPRCLERFWQIPALPARRQSTARQVRTKMLAKMRRNRLIRSWSRAAA